MEGQGNGDLAANTVEGRITLEVPDLAVASGLAKAPLQGRAALSLAATGALKQPQVDLTLDAGGLGYDIYGVRQLAVALQMKLLAPFETTFPGATLTGNASVAGVSQGGKPLAPEGAQGPLLTLDLAAKAPAEGPIDIQKALLQALGAQASLDGQFDPERVAGRLRLDLDVPALRPLVAAAIPDQAPDRRSTARSTSDPTSRSARERERSTPSWRCERRPCRVCRQALPSSWAGSRDSTSGRP